jgi:hypothetical protein
MWTHFLAFLSLLAVRAAAVCTQGSNTLLPRRPGDVATYQLELDITDGTAVVSGKMKERRATNFFFVVKQDSYFAPYI